ncbi:MAG TPA: SdrD B-like domain-containing protein, partial [Pirellulaceae bacterium]
MIYLDQNRNGVLDPGPGGQPLEPATITNAQGMYSFTNLLPGSYLVAEVSVAHWSVAYPTARNVHRHFLALIGDDVATPVSFGNSVFGDCDFDLDVDVNDQVAFNAAFHSKITSPNYVSCFDFDQDEDIDFADLYTFTANLGAQASLPRPPRWWPHGPVHPVGPLVPNQVGRPAVSGPEFEPTPHLPFQTVTARPIERFYASALSPGAPVTHALFEIDPSVAGLTAAGPTEPFLIGLSEAANGDVYGLTENGVLGLVGVTSGSFSPVTSFGRSFVEGDIAFQPGDTDNIWITTGRAGSAPGTLIHATLQGVILSQIPIPLEVSEFGFSGMQFLDANTLYLYEPETRRLVITDVNLINPTSTFFPGSSLGTRAGIDFDSTGRLWIVNKPASGNPLTFLYYVDTTGPWQLVPQGPGTTTSQWSSLVILGKPPVDPGQIVGIKWHDLDADGIRDPNEPGLPGWQINITGTNNQGQVISASTLTRQDDPLTPENEAGTYEFTHLPFGFYTVSEVLQPSWFQSYPAMSIHQVVLDDLNPSATAEFGNYRMGMIHGTKFEDRGPLPGRPLAGWEIVLTGLDAQGQFVQRSTVTMMDDPLTPEDETGQYWFSDVLPGNYHVEEVLQSGWFPAFPATGSYDVHLISGENPVLDFFNYRGGIIVGLVFQDTTDCEGPFTAGDAPLAGVVVYIDEDDDGMLDRDILGNPLEPFTTTSSSGMYQFTGLPYGTYRVRHEPLANYATSYPVSQSYQVTIGVSGQVAAEIDFGDFIYVPLDDGGDLIFASLGRDVVYGDNIVQNRCVLSYGDRDRIHGEEGDDLLIGQRRDDTYFFLPNASPSEIDVLIELDDHGTDDRDDEGLHDRLDFGALGTLEPVEVDLSGNRTGWAPAQIGYYQSNVGQHTITTDVVGQHNYIEDVLGGSGDDLITGNAKANWLNGGVGSDQVRGLNGDDTYAFGPFAAGDVDNIAEAIGTGGGTDTVEFSTIQVPVTVDLSATSLAFYGGASIISSSPQWFENVIGGQADDMIAGNLADNRLEGGLGNDTYQFAGTWGNDLVVEAANQGTDDVLDFSGATSLITSVVSTSSISV